MVLNFFQAKSSEFCCWSIISIRKTYGQCSIIGTIIWHEKCCSCACVRYHSAQRGYSNRRAPTLSFGARTKFLCCSWTEI